MCNRFHIWAGSPSGKFHQWARSTNGHVPYNGEVPPMEGSTNGQVPPMVGFHLWTGSTSGRFHQGAGSTKGQVQLMGRFNQWFGSTKRQVQLMGRFNQWAGSTKGQIQLMGRFNRWAGSTNGQVPPMYRFHHRAGYIYRQVPRMGRFHLWTGSINGRFHQRKFPPMEVSTNDQWAGYTYGQVPPADANKTSNRPFERPGLLFLFGKWQFQTVEETDGRPGSRTAFEERGSGVTYRSSDRPDRQQYEHIRHETDRSSRHVCWIEPGLRHLRIDGGSFRWNSELADGASLFSPQYCQNAEHNRRSVKLAWAVVGAEIAKYWPRLTRTALTLRASVGFLISGITSKGHHAGPVPVLCLHLPVSAGSRLLCVQSTYLLHDAESFLSS